MDRADSSLLDNLKLIILKHKWLFLENERNWIKNWIFQEFAKLQLYAKCVSFWFLFLSFFEDVLGAKQRFNALIKLFCELKSVSSPRFLARKFDLLLLLLLFLSTKWSSDLTFEEGWWTLIFSNCKIHAVTSMRKIFLNPYFKEEFQEVLLNKFNGIKIRLNFTTPCSYWVCVNFFPTEFMYSN